MKTLKMMLKIESTEQGLSYNFLFSLTRTTVPSKINYLRKRTNTKIIGIVKMLKSIFFSKGKKSVP